MLNRCGGPIRSLPISSNLSLWSWVGVPGDQLPSPGWLLPLPRPFGKAFHCFPPSPLQQLKPATAPRLFVWGDAQKNRLEAMWMWQG